MLNGSAENKHKRGPCVFRSVLLKSDHLTAFYPLLTFWRNPVILYAISYCMNELGNPQVRSMQEEAVDGLVRSKQSMEF